MSAFFRLRAISIEIALLFMGASGAGAISTELSFRKARHFRQESGRLSWHSTAMPIARFPAVPLSDTLFKLVLIALAFCAAALLVRDTLIVGAHVPLDPN